MKHLIIILTIILNFSLFGQNTIERFLFHYPTLAEEIIASNPGYLVRIDADGKYMKDADGKYILCRVTSQYASLLQMEFQNYALNKRNHNEKIIFDDKLFALILQRKRTRDCPV